MTRAGALAGYLRKQAEWRDRVAEKHGDHGSKGAAVVLRATAVLADTLPEDEPGLIAADSAGWLSSGEFVPTGPAEEYLRRWGRRVGYVTLEGLLYDLQCFAYGSEFWQEHARRVQGLAGQAGLRLIANRPRDTREPQWQSYSLESAGMGTGGSAGSLQNLEAYLQKRLNRS